jgi:hypothetical protein
VDSWLRLTLAFLSEEAEAGRPGAETVVTRIADLLFIEALRTYFSARLCLAALISNHPSTACRSAP